MKKLIRSIFKIKVFELLAAKFITKNRSPKSLICKIIPQSYDYKTNSLRLIKKKKLRFIIDLNDYIGHYIYFGFKDISHENLIKLVKKDYTILDVGANIGITLLQMASKTNKIVYGFEPHPKNYEKLEKNVYINNLNNIVLNNIGLGNKKGTFQLLENNNNNSGMHKISNDKTNNTISVKIDALDDFVAQNMIKKIDLIKIDVEGFELNVLYGSQDVISNFHPILFIELDDNLLKQQNNSARHLVEFLEANQYIIYNGDNNCKLKSSDNFANCHFDIICFPKKE